MAEIRIKACDFLRPPGPQLSGLTTGDEHVIVVEQKRASMVELDEGLFLSGSAALLRGAASTDLAAGATPVRPAGAGDGGGRSQGSSLERLAAVLQHVRSRPGLTLLVAGHAGSGEASAAWLSGDRAGWVHGLLTGAREAFVSLASGASLDPNQRVLEALLEGVALDLGWDCSPAKSGQGLREATRRFQDRYNRNGKPGNPGGPDLSLSGVFDPATWGGYFDTQQHLLADLMGVTLAALASLQRGLAFVQGPGVRCGADKPVQPADRTGRLYRSRADRRVEVLAFEGGQEPVLPCAAGSCRPGACELFDDRWYCLSPME